MGSSPQLDYAIHYRKWHDHEDPKHRSEFADYIQKLLEPVLPEDRQSPILEIGCSNGLGLLGLRSLGYTCLKGVDCSKALISIAKEFSLDVMMSDALEYLDALENNQFYLIYMIDTLEHIGIEQIPSLLFSAHQALAPGGKLFLQIPNADSPIGMHYRYIDWTHHCTFTTHSILHLLENAGFEEIHISESFCPQAPNPDQYRQDEESVRKYKYWHRKYREQMLARKITRWLMVQFLEEASEFPLTPNLNVTATKTNNPMPCKIDVAKETDALDPLGLIEQIKKNTEKIESMEEYQKYLEDKIMIFEKTLRMKHKKEITLGRLFRFPFDLGRAIYHLPTIYEKMINRQYYGEDNDT